jgi:alkanesulfonate monooxygenase SsuD/methylene tetrahydromethanopterin reductase-like flavin-dependent oxidoreductase (luciferase family)
MSGGRIEVGIGAGWYDAEHTAYGIPFPSTRERFDRFEEQLAILTGLWSTPTGETFNHDGRHYQLTEAPALAKPAQSPHPPIIIGGMGKRRTPELAARYAAEFNLPFRSEDDTELQFGRVRQACEDAGRDPESMTWSNALTVCVGADEDELARRAKAIGRTVEELRTNALAGTPGEVVDKLHRYAALGSQRAYLQVLDLSDLDHLRLVAEEVLPHV